MRALITGATGTIGLAAADALRSRGDTVVALSRDPDRGQRVLGPDAEVHAWAEPATTPPPAAALRVDAIVNVIGEPIDQRWTPEARGRIHDSRVLATQQLVAGLAELGESDRPGVLVSQSAVGYYGDRGEAVLDEGAAAGTDWLAELVVAWEEAARRAAPMMRVVTTRTGVVLSPTGGALSKMLPFFRIGVGGPVAGGGQYVPWIHLDDVVGGLLACVDDPSITGPANLTAPSPQTNAALSKALGHVLGRPAFLPVPGFAIKLLYGEMAELVIAGQRAVPDRLTGAGYRFSHPELEGALRAVLS